MPTKSILELEEARRRLEQMTEDHGQFVELIAKLKVMRDALAKCLGDSQDQFKKIEEQASRCEKVLTATWAMLGEFRKESKAALAEVNSVGAGTKVRLTELMGDTEKAIEGLVGNVAAARHDMENQFVALTEEQDRRFSVFREQHEKAVREIREAYEKAKGTVESHALLFDRLDAKVDKLIETQGEAIASLHGQLGREVFELDRRIAEVRQAAAASRTEWTTKIQELAIQLQSELVATRTAVSEQEGQLQSIRRRLRNARVVFWLLFTAGSLVLAAFVNQQRNELLDWWTGLILP